MEDLKGEEEMIQQVLEEGVGILVLVEKEDFEGGRLSSTPPRG